MAFLTELLDKDRLLTILYDILPDEVKFSKLYNQASLYLEKYFKFNTINIDDGISMYNHYIERYINDCKNFSKTGKYPLEIEATSLLIGREEYDVFLLLSILLTKHRFRIMQLIQQQNSEEKALFIGLGPGMELEVTKDKYSEIHGYDLSINNFLFSEFPNAHMNIELYSGQKKNYFDVIYLIEILEHINTPFALLEICRKSLKKGGKIILTTATDIPQFDHQYNFPLDHTDFEKAVEKMGFVVLQKEMIQHDYLMQKDLKWKPCNHFYVLEACI